MYGSNIGQNKGEIMGKQCEKSWEDAVSNGKMMGKYMKIYQLIVSENIFSKPTLAITVMTNSQSWGRCIK